MEAGYITIRFFVITIQNVTFIKLRLFLWIYRLERSTNKVMVILNATVQNIAAIDVLNKSGSTFPRHLLMRRLVGRIHYRNVIDVLPL